MAHQCLHGTTSELAESTDEFQIMDALTAAPRANGEGEPFDFFKTPPPELILIVRVPARPSRLKVR
jgi:hypothetical protein